MEKEWRDGSLDRPDGKNVKEKFSLEIQSFRSPHGAFGFVEGVSLSTWSMTLTIFALSARDL